MTGGDDLALAEVRPGRGGAAARAKESAGPVLALVSPSFNQVSETFVADHARALAPGRTVLVCGDGAGAERFGHPVLAGISPPARPGGGLAGMRDRLAGALRRRGGWGPLLDRAERARLADFLRAEGVGVVLAEFGYSGALVADVCARLGLPLFVCFRGHDATAHRRFPAIRRRYRRLFGQVAGIVAESRFIADELVAIGCPAERITVIASGTDPERQVPGRPEPGRVLAIGRLVPMKAPQLTLRAFATVAGAMPEARLDMVGDGPLRGLCEETVRELGLEGRVTLHGSLPHEECGALMRRAALFVQHSVTDPEGKIEGFPVVIAEAMASALPVVSTRHSGIPEHVRHGETGLLVPETDVEGMAAAMLELLREPDTAAAMGRAGRAYALENLTRARAHKRLRALMRLDDAAAGA